MVGLALRRISALVSSRRTPNKSHVEPNAKAYKSDSSKKNSPSVCEKNTNARIDKKEEEEEDALMRALQANMTVEYVLLNERIRKKPFSETLSRPSSLVRAAIALPMPWVCLYTVWQLHVATSEDTTTNDSVGYGCRQYIVAFFLGYFWADFVSGLVHMALDTTKLHVRTLLGKAGLCRTIIEFTAWGFQRHHCLQRNWQFHDDLLESGVLTAGVMAAVPFYFVYLWLYWNKYITSPYTAFGWTVGTTSLLCVQLFHALAHHVRSTKAHNPNEQHRNTYIDSLWNEFSRNTVQLLRRLHFILDIPDHHLHHTRFDQNFALINGWSNVILNPLYAYLEAHGFIDPEYQGAAQRRLYIDQKVTHKEPYLTLYPEYRAWQLRQRD